MDLEQQIKDLERQLALKKAYLSLKVNLPKTVPEDIKVEIEAAITAFCAQKANGTVQADVQNATQNVANSNNQFTDQELAILKGVVQAALEKSGGKVIKKAPEKGKPLTAMLMTTDSIPVDRRKLVESNAQVQIISYNDKEACFTFNKNRFVVPLEDLQFEQEGDK